MGQRVARYRHTLPLFFASYFLLRLADGPVSLYPRCCTDEVAGPIVVRLALPGRRCGQAPGASCGPDAGDDLQSSGPACHAATKRRAGGRHHSTRWVKRTGIVGGLAG